MAGIEEVHACVCEHISIMYPLYVWTCAYTYLSLYYSRQQFSEIYLVTNADKYVVKNEYFGGVV